MSEGMVGDGWASFLNRKRVFEIFSGKGREDSVFFPICGPFSLLTNTSQHPVEILGKQS